MPLLYLKEKKHQSIEQNLSSDKFVLKKKKKRTVPHSGLIFSGNLYYVQVLWLEFSHPEKKEAAVY